MMKYGVSYTRVSTGQQVKEKTSLQTQEAANIEKAEAMGVVIVEYFSDEGVSGELFEGRPGIQSLLKRLSKGDIHFVFINKLDRAGRNTTSLHQIRERIQKAGAQCIFSGGQEFNNDSGGNFMHTVFAGVASFEKELIKERTMRGSRAKVTERGEMVATNSPYGYHIVTYADIIRGTYPPEMKGKYVLDTETMGIAQWIFATYANGSSLRAICVSLSKWRVPSPRSTTWSVPGIRLILSNPVYKGQPAYGRNRNVTDESRLASGHKQAVYKVQVDPDKWLHMEAPVLVSKELWDSVQEIRRQNKAMFAGNPKYTYLLSGFMVCPGCGRKMRGGKSGRDGKTYYRCHKTVDTGRHPCEWKLHFPAADIDRHVMSFLFAAAADKSVIEEAITAYLAQQPVTSPQAGMTESEFNERKKKMDTQERLLVMEKIEAIRENQEATLYEGMIHEIRESRTSLVIRWEEQNPKPLLNVEKLRSRTEQYQAVMSMYKEVLESCKTTNRERKKILQQVLVSVVPDIERNLTIRVMNGMVARYTVASETWGILL